MNVPRWAEPVLGQVLDKLQRIPPAALAGAGGAAALSLLVWLGLAVWPSVSYWRAGRAERKGQDHQAAAMFEKFAQRRPADPRAPEALFRAAQLYAKGGHCEQAAPLYERLARERTEEPWPERARHGLLTCPDYFPLTDAALVYVDSQTGGEAMRLDLKSKVSEDGTRAKLKGAYFAGTRRVQDFNRTYEKADWSIWEKQGKSRVRIIRYPYKPGITWSDRRDGFPVDFTVMATDAKVKVKAGTFSNCLKIKEQTGGSPAWKFDYYAPGVGRVKTTIGGSGFESPNTELKSFAKK